MPEPRPDMLPDASQTDPAVSEDVTPPQADPPAPASSPADPPAPPARDIKTPPNELHAALMEERRLRKEEHDARVLAEQKLRQKEEDDAPSDPVYDEPASEEGRALQGELSAANARIERLERDRDLDRLAVKFPAISDKREEFETFLEGYPKNANRENLAKLFLSEKGILDAPPARKGLERTSGGTRTPGAPAARFTKEQIEDLMKNDSRRFNKLVASGVIRPEDLEG